ncbi:MAG: type II CAAX prenyl endopeptidase Rce1 family protein [Flavobacteriales bacterium]
MKNPFFQEMSPGVRAVLFGSFILVCAGIGAMAAIALAIANGFSVASVQDLVTNPGIEHIELLKWMNNLSQVSTFLLPVGLYLFIFGAPNAFRANMPPTFFMVLLGILWMALSGGVIDLSAQLNRMLIPEGSALEAWLKPTEEKAEQLTYMILNYSGVGSLISTIFCIAIIPAICEELAFRGVLQPLLIGATKNIHLGVWISAIIFSFFHFQFYGFLPRMILGAMLGYLFIWSGSLWVSVLAHLANNALAIVLFHYNGMSLTAPEDDFQNSILFYSISIALFVAVLLILRSKRIPESGWLIES